MTLSPFFPFSSLPSRRAVDLPRSDAFSILRFTRGQKISSSGGDGFLRTVRDISAERRCFFFLFPIGGSSDEQAMNNLERTLGTRWQPSRFRRVHWRSRAACEQVANRVCLQCEHFRERRSVHSGGGASEGRFTNSDCAWTRCTMFQLLGPRAQSTIERSYFALAGKILTKAANAKHVALIVSLSN